MQFVDTPCFHTSGMVKEESYDCNQERGKMKIYWVTSKDYGKCFFCLTHDIAQYQCDFRMDQKNYDWGSQKADPSGSWWVEDEEIPDKDFGYCINGLPDQPRPSLTLPYKSDCSVGMVRKMRNGVDNDDGTCATCPYYTKEKPDPK